MEILSKGKSAPPSKMSLASRYRKSAEAVRKRTLSNSSRGFRPSGGVRSVSRHSIRVGIRGSISRKIGRTGRADWSDRVPQRCMTNVEMNKLQLCCPCPGGDMPYIPTCICVQQTPRVVAKRNIVWVQKVKLEPQVINTTRTVMIPKVVQVEKVVKVPEVIWTEGCVNAPRIEYRKQNIKTYEIRQQCRNILAPQEICTSFICRPKPQYVCIPPPTNYCCYPIDALNYVSQCSPIPPYHPNEPITQNAAPQPYVGVNQQPMFGTLPESFGVNMRMEHGMGGGQGPQMANTLGGNHQFAY